MWPKVDGGDERPAECAEHLNIVPFAKQCGFILGPAAGTSSWVEPILKRKQRTAIIHDSGGGPLVGIFAYTIRAASVLAYVGQLLPPRLTIFSGMRRRQRRSSSMSPTTLSPRRSLRPPAKNSRFRGQLCGPVSVAQATKSR